MSEPESTREASPPLAADRALPPRDESAQHRAGTDERETLGRLVHDVRRSFSEGLDRPFVPSPWEERTGPQRELDMRIGAAVRDAVLNSGSAGGEIVREAWVYWALEQPDVAEHPNWLKSWAELDERDREADDRIYAAVAAHAAAAGIARAERAEAQVLAVRRYCSERASAYLDAGSRQTVAGVFAALGSEEGHSAACTNCGQQFADSETSEYEFASRERLERLLYADGWKADPVLCPACQPGEPS